MSLPEGLLQPISSENPSGSSLRYDPVFDLIRETRREEEALSQGVWSCAVKRANFPKVIQLTVEALRSKTKDLQLAAWLTEASLVSEGLPGLIEGLQLVRGLLERFWPTLYPEMEDGDLESRVGPIEWIATRLDTRVYRVPLTKNKLDWLKFDESRRVGYEADTVGNEAKAESRRVAISEGKCTAEEFDEGARHTPPDSFEKLHSDLLAAKEAIDALEAVCDEKFAKIAPSFSGLKKAVGDLQDAVLQYWQPAPAAEQSAAAEPPQEQLTKTLESPGTVASSPAASTSAKAVSEELADREEAFRRLGQIAAFFRKEDPASPLGYLLLRSARWGELRTNGSSLDPSLLDPPPTEVRQAFKKLANDGQWAELLQATEAAMSSPWSRGWLDLQRFAVRASESLGYTAVSAAICSQLRSLLADLPALSAAALADDTSAANAETQSWLQQSVLPITPAARNPVEEELAEASASRETQAGGAPDVFELAKEAARQGKVQESIEMISHEIMRETSGRGRFTRKIQLASICVAAKRESLAYPILTEVAEEIDNRKLEEWEDGETLASALGLLLRCADQLDVEDATRKKIFQKICRLSPVQALSAMR
jgi:type VI secretion system protein ImpA